MSTNTRDVLLGFASLAGVNVAFAGLAFVGARVGVDVLVIGLFAIGLVQLLWALPWQIWAFLTGRKSFGLGLVIAAGLTLLINGACFVAVAGGLH